MLDFWVGFLRLGKPTSFIELPPKFAGILHGGAQQSCLVHKLLGDAAHVDAGAPQAWLRRIQEKKEKL